MKVYALLECDYEGCELHAIYSNKRAALKSMLALKSKMVEQHLEAQRMFQVYNRDFYRETWDIAKLHVCEYEVLDK